VEETSGSGQARATEEAKELLGAMADQEKAKDKPQNEQTGIHDAS